MSLPLEDKDILTCEDESGNTVTYEVICIAEDDNNKKLAISYSQTKDDFMVTDLEGNKVDTSEAASVLDAFDLYIQNEI